MIKKAAFTLLAAVALATGANAQILTAFNVSGFGTAATGPTPVVDPSVTATALARNTVVFASAANSFNSNTWNITNTINYASNYIAFDITAGAANVTISSLGFAVNGSNTAPNTGMWTYFLTGATTPTDSQTPFTTLNAQPTARSLWDFTDFTLAATTTVEFRFYEFGATSINGGTAAVGGTTRIANVTTPSAPQYDLVVNGPNAAVEPLNPAAPEPSAMAIMAAAAGLFGFMIYRRNQAA